jgi:Ser/Thr protein kinase RdoA (MazF antagonist)
LGSTEPPGADDPALPRADRESAADATLPYADLDPTAVLDAVESVGFACSGHVFALNSFENRVFRIGLEDAPPVVGKFYRPGRWADAAIVEELEFTRELEQAEIPVVAPLVVDGECLFRHAGFRFALFPLRGGLAPELDQADTLEQLGRALGRLHQVGAQRAFKHRGRIDLLSHGEAPLATLMDGGWLPPELEESFEQTADALLDAIEDCFDASAPLAELRLHGDCHPGNLLWREGQIQFVDFDDCLTGPAMQDLWMLLSGSREDMRRQLGHLLEGYSQFYALDPRELVLIEALRSLRLLHYNAWLARRWRDPAFPAAFPWFGERSHFDRLLGQLRDQLDLLEGPALRL